MLYVLIVFTCLSLPLDHGSCDGGSLFFSSFQPIFRDSDMVPVDSECLFNTSFVVEIEC